MQRRRRFKQFKLLEHRLTDEANRLRGRAEGMPPGEARDLLLLKAREADITSAVSEWLRSPAQQAQ